MKSSYTVFQKVTNCNSGLTFARISFQKSGGVGDASPLSKKVGGRRSPRPRPTTPLVEPTCQFGRTATRSGQNGRRHNRFAAIGQRTRLVLELGLRATITNNVRYRGACPRLAISRGRCPGRANVQHSRLQCRSYLTTLPRGQAAACRGPVLGHGS